MEHKLGKVSEIATVKIFTKIKHAVYRCLSIVSVKQDTVQKRGQKERTPLRMLFIHQQGSSLYSRFSLNYSDLTFHKM